MFRIVKKAPLALAFVLFATSPSWAQDTTAQQAHDPAAHGAAPGGDEQAMMEKWTAYMTPGEAHAHLAMMEGDWDWTMKTWMAPDAPPQETSGTMESEMIYDGRYLVEQYEGTMMGMPFVGRSLTGYDNNREEYFSTWIDNLGTGIMVSRGTFDPATKTLTMHGTYDDIMTGARDQQSRIVITHPDENTTLMEMYMAGPEGEEVKTMEIRATRDS